MLTACLSEEQEAYREAARALADDRIRPAADDAERAGAIPEPVWVALVQMGLAAPVPEELGGPGLADLVTLVAAVEAIAVGDPGIAFGAATDISFGLMVTWLGSAEQQARHLTPLAGGAGRGAVLHFEGFGRGLDDLATTAARADGGWTVTGHKIAVAHPRGVRGVVVATGPDGPCALVVEDLSTVEVVRDDAEVGKLGLLAVPTADVRLDGLVIGADDRLGGKRPGDVAAAAAAHRILLSAVALGAGQAALEYAASYATEREAFGQPIARFQGVSFPLAEVDMTLNSARLHLFDLARRVEDDAAAAVDAAVTAAVTEVTDAALRATTTGINTLGGHGFLTDHPLERWHRAVGTLASMVSDPAARPFALA